MPTTTRLDRLPRWCDRGRTVANVIVESPRGSGAKLKYEPALGLFVLVRPLALGLVFPFEFGFVPSTRAEDGDPLDAVVLADAGTATGVLLRCRPVALVRASQRGDGDARVRNDRVVMVACEDRRRNNVQDARDLSPREREEMEAFFVASVVGEGKDLELLGWGDRDEARAAIDLARRRP